MTVPEGGRSLWCMHCGAPSTYLTESMDPDRPVGLCSSGQKVCARGLATYDRAEVERLLAARAQTAREIRAARKAVGGFWNAHS